MSFFKELSDQLFPKKKEESSSAAKVPYIQEMLKRSAKDLFLYEDWKLSHTKTDQIQFLQDQYELSQNQEEFSSVFRYINQASTRGFMLRHTQNISTKDFQHFFDFLHKKVTELPYLPYLSDVRIYDKKEGVERIERHYLKPSWRKQLNQAKTEKIDQQYGNIRIELLFLDDQPQHISFNSQVYLDGKYAPALDFNHLMQHLCLP